MATGTDVSNVVRMALIGELFGQEIVNVFHYRLDSAPTVAKLDALMAAWVATKKALYADCVTDDYFFKKLSARSVVPGGVQSELVLTGAGALVFDAMPTQLAGLISWRTGYAGRRARGRTYLPALAENYVSAGLIDQILLTKYATFANSAKQIDVDAVPQTLVIFSDPDQQMSPTPPPGGRSPAWYDVTTIITPNVPATQRKRRVGVGS